MSVWYYPKHDVLVIVEKYHGMITSTSHLGSGWYTPEEFENRGAIYIGEFD